MAHLERARGARVGVVLALALGSRPVWSAWSGCVGTGAALQAQVRFAEQVGGALFVVSLLLGLVGVGFVGWRGLERRVLAPLVLVVVAHPGAWMDAGSSGDCGQQMTFAAVVFTLQAVALLGWILARPRVIVRLEEG